jgi:hypothetical protein
MAGLTCICEPEGMTANCELPTSNWEGIVVLLLCIAFAALYSSMRCYSDDPESDDESAPPDSMYK